MAAVLAASRALLEKVGAERAIGTGIGCGVVAGGELFRGGNRDAVIAERLVGNGRNGRMGSHLVLNKIGYEGPLSIEWVDAGVDRLQGPPEALEFVRRQQFDAPSAAFDAAFSTQG